jgi:hypothetical protein
LLTVADLAAGDHDPSASAEALEHELARLRAELEEYQGLIDELPEIYEAKFTHQLRDVAQDVRRLMDERQALQEQINRCLEAGAAMPLLAAAPEHAPTPTPARPRLSPAALAAARRWLNRQPGWRLGLMAGTAAFALAIAAGLRWRPAPVSAPQPDGAAQAVAPGAQPPAEPLPAAPQPAADPELRLRANGEAWLEVQTLAGEVVYVNTLQDGQAATIRLGQGLRIRSGRPDLLEFAVADQPFVLLGPVYDLDWRTVRPPDPGGPSS